MQFAVIDNNRQPMNPDMDRGEGFARALSEWTFGKDYDFVRYYDLAARRNELMRCRGLILSGSAFDFALPDGGFDRGVYEAMTPEFQLMQDFQGPILGICFGHQLMAIADEFEPGRKEFGALRVRDMADPPEEHVIVPVRMKPPLRFLDRQELWAQFHHKQEVVLADGLLEYFEVLAGSGQCSVHVMQHRYREWFGIQFHPEIGKQSKAGAIDRHQDAVKDGQAVLQSFVRYCLR